MVYFAQEDAFSKLLPIEKACVYKDIFIVGLIEDELVYSDEPFYLQNLNGRMVGVNEQFTRFYVVDKQRHIKQKLSIEWTDQCDAVEALNQETLQTDLDSSPQNAYLSLTLLFVLVLIWSGLRK